MRSDSELERTHDIRGRLFMANKLEKAKSYDSDVSFLLDRLEAAERETWEYKDQIAKNTDPKGEHAKDAMREIHEVLTKNGYGWVGPRA